MLALRFAFVDPIVNRFHVIHDVTKCFEWDIRESIPLLVFFSFLMCLISIETTGERLVQRSFYPAFSVSLAATSFCCYRKLMNVPRKKFLFCFLFVALVDEARNGVCVLLFGKSL
jgi:hypothetical protein